MSLLSTQGVSSSLMVAGLPHLTQKLRFARYGSTVLGPPGYGGKDEIQSQNQTSYGASTPNRNPATAAAKSQSSHEPPGLVSIL